MPFRFFSSFSCAAYMESDLYCEGRVGLRTPLQQSSSSFELSFKSGRQLFSPVFSPLVFLLVYNFLSTRFSVRCWPVPFLLSADQQNCATSSPSSSYNKFFSWPDNSTNRVNQVRTRDSSANDSLSFHSSAPMDRLLPPGRSLHGYVFRHGRHAAGKE